MEILKVENLRKEYGRGEAKVTALDGISFSVERGDFVAIIGPSGSGKSTLLHILGGVDKPTSGKVYVNGEDVYGRSEEQLAIFRRREVGLIYQFYNLIPVLDVVENMTLPVQMDGRKINNERLEELLRRQGYFVVYGIVTDYNAGSCAFHRAMGYRETARLENCGFKFGQWYGIVWFEKRLREGSPTEPPTAWSGETTP